MKRLNMTTETYSAPACEAIEIDVEQGFLLSGVTDGSDYGDGGEGQPMD